jgi:hypothetical protein
MMYHIVDTLSSEIFVVTEQQEVPKLTDSGEVTVGRSGKHTKRRR